MPAITLSTVKALTCLLFRATSKNSYQQPHFTYEELGYKYVTGPKHKARKWGRQGLSLGV